MSEQQDVLWAIYIVSDRGTRVVNRRFTVRSEADILYASERARLYERARWHVEMDREVWRGSEMISTENVL